MLNGAYLPRVMGQYQTAADGIMNKTSCFSLYIIQSSNRPTPKDVVREECSLSFYQSWRLNVNGFQMHTKSAFAG